ncbi:P-type conjugative transfer protein TrbG [Phenylobacterium aquaticum]|uniref:P-type conjugative transfer protein TrbG n=1 Tax=Phenylobacterium aquaticum TaxID=1763816 RepID=UPI001F5C1872|nr:P-type conjugative transfer protein TrbG [Phenylobacterium aquaticum]MCI3132850.1 P-type conjugative transfer protein TrbG [Phenylobacterium aquaticum]
MRTASKLLLFAATCVSGCASHPAPPPPAALAPVAVAPEGPPPAPVVYRPTVFASTPVPNPPERPRTVPPSPDPMTQVARANAVARMQPSLARFSQAEQVYAFAEGGVYQVYAAPGRITDIVLQSGETLVATGPVAAGDTTRWVIGDTESGAGPDRRVHILVKPTRQGLSTNLVINTNRRTYHLDLSATVATAMVSVAWRYPQDDARAAQESARAKAAEVALQRPTAAEDLNFGYRIEGAHPAWRPSRVFDDGRQTVIEFPASVAQDQLPPLFVGDGRGRPGDLVNYRVKGRTIIVDRLFKAAELRLGDRHNQQIVRILRLAER